MSQEQNPTLPSDLLPDHEPALGPQPLPTEAPPPFRSRRGVQWRWIIWIVLISFALLMMSAYGQAIFFGSPEVQTAGGKPRFIAPGTPTATAAPTATPSLEVAPLALIGPTAIPTPVPGGQTLVVTPVAEKVGWVMSGSPGDRGPNYFGDSFLYTGILNGQVYHGAIQFDLDELPRGVKIYEASLHLTGLRADQAGGEGLWQLQLLSPAIDYRWQNRTYPQLHEAEVLTTLAPVLTTEQLAAEQVNVFHFTAEQLAFLEQRVLEGSDQYGKTVSFRLDGPLEGKNNLFAWDSGYGGASKGAAPELFLSVGPPPQATPPPHYVVITSTPTPADIIAAAATSLQMTVEATQFGTATPVPPSWVTPFIVTVTPTAANQATAEAMESLATAIALTTGEAPSNLAVATPTPTYIIITSTPTPQDMMTAVAALLQMTAEAAEYGTATPLPANWVTPAVVTVTPTPANTATAAYLQAAVLATGTPTPTPANLQTATPSPTYVMITSTPTPQDIMTAAAISLQLTAEAARYGTATPLPTNWVTPVVVTMTPTPANEATVVYLQAIALTTGTPTPTPANLQTATPTPIYIPVGPLLSPTPTSVPTGTPQPVPLALLGKIVFLSDREGASPEERERAAQRQATPQVTPQPYVFDPETGELGRLTDIWPYEVARRREAWSANTTYEIYNKELLWTNVEVTNGEHTVRVPTTVLALHYYDYEYQVERIVTRMGTGIVYDPVWSPIRNEIAFVATESGNDEIWVINHDGSNVHQLTRNPWEWDKHPSWSPDGEQIVFFSNRTGQNQLWIMNRDGSNQRLLMEANPYNDFNPVWVKYSDPAPALARQPDWRFVKPPEESK